MKSWTVALKYIRIAIAFMLGALVLELAGMGVIIAGIIHDEMHLVIRGLILLCSAFLLYGTGNYYERLSSEARPE